MLKEVWRAVPDFDYEVSSQGIVRPRGSDKKSIKPTIKIISPNNNSAQYMVYHQVTLKNESGKESKHFVHKLVGKVFIEHPDNFNFVHHRNMNGTDNRVANLYWSKSGIVEATHSRVPKSKPSKATKVKHLAAGTAGAEAVRAKAVKNYKTKLGKRFIKYYNSGEIFKLGAVSYICTCGKPRVAGVSWTELSKFNGVCHACRPNTKGTEMKSLIWVIQIKGEVFSNA